MLCPNCRSPILVGAAFCQTCGRRLPTASPITASSRQRIARSGTTESGELAGMLRTMMRIDVVVLCLAPLIFAGIFAFGHFFFARTDLDALRDCARRVGPANCTDLHGTYNEIVADCEAWPPVFADRLSPYVQRLCAVALPTNRTT